MNEIDQVKANPWAVSVRIEHRSASQWRGQRRHDLRVGSQPSYVDKNRAHLNRIIVEPAQASQLRAICEARREARQMKRRMKSSAAVSTAGIVTFGHKLQPSIEGLPPAQQNQLFMDVVEAVAVRLNTSVHGLVIHLDESAIHAHFSLASIDLAGHPLSKTTRPAITSELQDIAHQVVQRYVSRAQRGRQYGDRIAAGARRADTIHKQVRQLHYELPADLAAARADLEAARTRADDAQARVNDLEARVRELGELNAREEKRLDTYRRRYQARADELAETEGRLAKLKNNAKEIEKRALEATERALERQADLRRWQEALKAREEDLARSKVELAEQAAWVAHGVRHLQIAMQGAVSGTYNLEITAADMAKQPETFAVLRRFAPNGRPTWGWSSLFLSLNDSNSGAPVPEQHLPAKVREALTEAFEQVAAWASEIPAQASKLAAREQKVNEAERAIEGRLGEASRFLAEARERATLMTDESAQIRSRNAKLAVYRDVLLEIYGQETYDVVEAQVRRVWATHHENLDRGFEEQQPSQDWGGPSGP